MDWLPGATRRDAPASKHGYGGVPEPQAKQGVVFHSMEGSLAAALGELDKLSRQASWTFSNPKSGPMLQHYPLGFHTWASGSDIANVRFTSIEHEGVAGEPLTPSQVANDIALLKWMGLDWKRPANPSDLTATLYEHRECVRFGSASTACPSGRIPWAVLLSRLQPQATAAINGWRSEPPHQVLYNGSVPVLRVGGGLPGRISKLFGDRYLWL